MKNFWKILSMLLLALILSVCLVACGDNTDSGTTTNKGTTGGTTGGSTTVILDDLDTSRVKFKGENTVAYDGEYHTYETLSGQPDRADVTFEYYKNDVKVGDGGTGVKDPGVYEVHAIFSRSGYHDATVTATFTIEASYEITYAIGLPATLPAGTTLQTEDCPNYFTTSATPQTLGTASLTDYKFKGWYTTSDCSGEALTELVGANYDGNITLYAKFQAYLPYPKPYVYSTTVTEEPTTIPAIPGYTGIASDALKLIDMSNLEAVSARYLLPTTLQSPYNNFKVNDSITTAGGQSILQWKDYNDTYAADEVISDEETRTFEAGDNSYNSSLVFYSPASVPNGADTEYDTLEFWIYCANTTVTAENPDGDNIHLYLFNSDSVSLRYSIQLDFSGWKKFSISYSDFYRPNGGTMNITRVQLYACDQSVVSAKASLASNKDTNFIYFSDMFLTNHQTAYKVNSGLASDALVSLLENVQNLTLKATKTDAEVASYLSSITGLTDTGATGVWSDLPLTDSSTDVLWANFAATYERVYYLAQSWNSKDSTYYRSEELLSAIGGVLNDMSDVALEFTAEVDTLNESIAYYCIYLADIVNIIGDHINEQHAQAWMTPVLKYMPSAIGEGETALLSAYVYTTACLAQNDQQGALAGLRQLTSLFNLRKITLATNSADIVRVMSLLASIDGTKLASVGNTFVDDLFTWFYECVDAITLNGVIPEGLNEAYSLVPYLRGMFLIYDQASAETQAKFAATVKYYLEKDATLEAALTAAQYYDREATVLAAIKGASVTAATKDNAVSIINEKIGQAIYKNDDYYFLISSAGTLVTNQELNLTAASYEVFKGLANDEVLALVADDKVIVVDENGVTVSEEQGYGKNGSSQAYVLKGNTRVTESGAYLTESNTDCIVLVTVDDIGVLTCTVYNYTDETSDITLYFAGIYDLVEITPTLEYTNNTSRQTTSVTIHVSELTGNVYTFTLQ